MDPESKDMSGWFDIGAAGVSGLASLAGRIGQKGREKRQMNYQRELMDIQQRNQMALNQQAADLSYDQWLRTNYSAQVQQMEKAGLNPALMYGQGGPGGTTQTGSGGGAAGGAAPKVEHPYLDINSMLQASMLEAQKKLIEANADKAKAEAENLRGQPGTIGESVIQLNTQEVKNKQAQEALTKANKYLADLQGEITSRSLEDIIDQYYWNANKSKEEASIAASQAYVDKNTREQRIALVDAQLATSVLAAGLMEAQTAKTWEEARKTANDILISQGMLEVAQRQAGASEVQARAANRNSITNQEGVYWNGRKLNQERSRDDFQRELQKQGLDIQQQKLVLDAILGVTGKLPDNNIFNYNGPGPQR